MSTASGAARKLWSDESMVAATACISKGDMSVREASRVYNIPFETLRRRVTGKVQLGARPGPPTVLTDEEEDYLAKYLVEMADMGVGLSRDTVMRLAYKIVEKSQRKHPFREERAGRAWFDGFRRRHPKLTIRSPQPLSYCRALSSNPETIEDFFGKLGAIYGKLNLISKPMQVYNCDETSVTIVHKPGKVVTQLGRRNVYAITSGERGKTHTVLACVSASGFVLPPMMVYPRKKELPPNCKEGAVPNTFFANSDSGWMNAELFCKWFEFFLHNIPPLRPVLLVMDGHGSHISVEVIELARANDIHMLCLPAHTTHILQPLDIGVFKSFKVHFSKAASKYMADNPGRVITAEKLASLVGQAWPNSHTALNIMAGFKKSGIYPINPSEVTDRQLMPSKAVTPHGLPKASPSIDDNLDLFSPEKEKLFEQRYQEGYDVEDHEYIAWLKINHPGAEVDSVAGSSKSSDPKSKSDDLSDILPLPCPSDRPAKPKKKNPSLNSKTICITDTDVFEQIKEITQTKEKKKKKSAQKETAKKIHPHEKNSAQKSKKETVKKTHLQEGSKQIQPDANSGSESESDAVCPKCGLIYSDSTCRWVCCDKCNAWYDEKCANLKTKRIPKTFYCENCL